MHFPSADVRFALKFYAAPQVSSKTGTAARWSRLGGIIRCALLILPTLVYYAHPVFAQAEGSHQKELSRVESWFKGKTLAEVSSSLASSRSAVVSASDKALLMKDLPLLNADNRVDDTLQIRTLQARLEKTLNFFERVQVVEVIVFRHSQPIVHTNPGVVILISTELLKVVHDDDDALAGIIAHELAHESVALEFMSALQSGNLSRMRELELFCDAVAVVAMLNLGFDPVRYSRAVKRIATHSQKSAELNNGENSHPTVAARLRVISYVLATLKPTLSKP